MDFQHLYQAGILEDGVIKWGNRSFHFSSKEPSNSHAIWDCKPAPPHPLGDPSLVPQGRKDAAVKQSKDSREGFITLQLFGCFYRATALKFLCFQSTRALLVADCRFSQVSASARSSVGQRQTVGRMDQQGDSSLVSPTGARFPQTPLLSILA